MLRRVLVIAALVTGLAGAAAAQTSARQIEVLKEAAAKGSAPAQYALGAAAEQSGDFAGALRWYRQSATAGYAGAQHSLALMLDAGLGTTPDPLEAERLLQRAAAANFEPALQRLVRMERARAEASKSLAAAPSAVTPSTPGLLERSRRFVVSGWGLGAGLVLLAALALFWTRSREATTVRERVRSHARSRRHR